MGNDTKNSQKVWAGIEISVWDDSGQKLAVSGRVEKVDWEGSEVSYSILNELSRGESRDFAQEVGRMTVEGPFSEEKRQDLKGGTIDRLTQTKNGLFEERKK
jgi:hypothetical protein